MKRQSDPTCIRANRSGRFCRIDLAGRSAAPMVFAAEADKPALLGGTPVHDGGWPDWPEWRESWEPDVLEVLRSGQWCRAGGGGQVAEFETAYAKLLGAKRCLATASGTTALITACTSWASTPATKSSSPPTRSSPRTTRS